MSELQTPEPGTGTPAPRGTDPTTERNRVEFRDTSAKGLFLSGILIALTGAVVEALAILPKLIFYDVLYFSNVVRFTLETTRFWQAVGGAYVAFGLSCVAFAAYYRARDPGPRTRRVARGLAVAQLFLPPTGTFFGALLLLELRENARGRDGTASPSEPTRAAIKREVGLATSAAALVHVAFLSVVYLLTVYLSTMMLDLTYPYLTMRVINQVRVGLFVLFGTFAGQFAFGLAYGTKYDRKAARALGYFFGILQVFFFPVGTYVGVTLLKDLRYDLAESVPAPGEKKGEIT
ncbi:MAG: hypothetical protein ACTSU5_01750 [Promethearchaeota archaeon]